MQGVNPIFFNEPYVPSWHEGEMKGLDPFDADAVRARMKELGVKQSDLAKEMGLNQSAISNMLNSGRGVKAHEAAFIYRRLGMEAPATIDLVPVIGITAAGNWREAVVLPRKQLPVPTGVAGPNSFALEHEGDSMDLVIIAGAYIVVDPDQTQLYNDRVYLLENSEHETTVKVYRSNPARFEPRSSNETHQPIFMGEQPIRVIGRVVWQGMRL